MAGTDSIPIREATTAHDIETIKTLFLEYAETLDFSLSFQGFEEERTTLPGVYSPPRGCLWLATHRIENFAGCVALRPIGSADAEMKRLYVRPAYRGQALGKRLAEEAVMFARDTGYAALRLDTIAETMTVAENCTAIWDSSKRRPITKTLSPERRSTHLI